MVFVYLKTLIVVVMVFSSLTLPYLNLGIETDFKQDLQMAPRDVVTGNFLINMTIDRGYGFIKSYTYRNIQITSTRFFKEGEIHQCLIYDIIPPEEEAMIRFEDWWPGIAFLTVPSIKTYQPSMLRSIVEVNYTVSYRLKVTKRYVVYLDKLYFDIEYIFRNEFDREIVVNHSSPIFGFGREVSFAIELSSAFGGSAENDLQVIGFLTYREIREKTSIKEPYVDPYGVKFVALVSNRGDYDIPQALILIPLNITKTFGALMDVSTIGGRISSSIVRLEMKPFTVPPRGVQRFVFRAYMGPLSLSVLEELGIPELSGAIARYTLGLLDPSYIVVPEYKPPPHNIRISMATTDPGFYPNTTISLYRVTEEGLVSILENKPLRPMVLRDQEQGYYIVRINPTIGQTVNGKAFYRNVKVNNQSAERGVLIPVFTDTEIVVTYDIVRMIRLVVTIIDENYRKLGNDYVSKLKLTLVSRTTGRKMVVSLTQDMVLVLDEDVYDAYIDRELNGRILTDIYLRALRVVHRVSTLDEKPLCVFTLDLTGPFEHGDVIIRYGGGSAPGVDPFVIYFLVSIVVLTIALTATVAFITIRGRR